MISEQKCILFQMVLMKRVDLLFRRFECTMREDNNLPFVL